MLKKLFGGNKSGYYLELKEEDSQEKSSQPEKSAQPKAEKPAEAPATVAQKPTEPAQNSSKSKKTSIKAKKSGSEKQANSTSESVPLLSPFPEMVSFSSQNGKAEPEEVAFASKNLPNPAMARRRPGPSLNTFKTMARQVKKPSSKG